MKDSLLRGACFIVVAILAALQAMPLVTAQEIQSSALAQPNSIPGLISYAGVLKDASGQARSSVVGVTFLLYRDEQGGAPLWMETQNVVPDKAGRYSVQLGAASARGIPANVFQTGEARWLAVQMAGETEQSRVMLVAVPYAMKAADAATIGGLPPSAFVLAAPVGSPLAGTLPSTALSSESSPSVAPTTAITGTGTANYVPLWTGTNVVGNSAIFQTGSGTTAHIGINTSTPGVALAVKGAATIQGALALPAQAQATAAAGKNSEPLNFTASLFNSGTATPNSETFRWLAEPAANNTASPSATLNLLFGAGTAAPAETGLKITNNGQITFAAGQTFPGTGHGTITGVTAGTGLSGGGTSGNATLNVDSTQVPLLSRLNTFTENQQISGTLYSNEVITAGPVIADNYYVTEGSNHPFAFGNFVNGNVFLGFAGNQTLTGAYNTAVGPDALAGDTTGGGNVAVGQAALSNNLSGYSLTCVGYGCDVGADRLFMATAIGAYSTISQSNSLILGGVGGNGVSVGIGTSTPYSDYGVTIDAAHSNPKITGGIVVNASTGNEYLGMTNGVHKFRVDVNGVVYADGGYQSSGADFAESVAVNGPRSTYEPGDVLEIDQTADRHLALSSSAYSHLVAGIYSTKPGMLASPHAIDDAAIKTSEVPLAVIGIVPCKVTAANGAIQRGDLLVTSARRGYAMKGTDHRRMLGAVVGKALEPLPKGEGVIQVLVTLQ